MAQIIIYGGIFAVMFAFLILPQQRRQKEAAALLASLEEGDEVVMVSGIHGFISSIDGDVLWVEVAAGVDLKVSRSAVVNKVVEVEETADGSVDERNDDEHSADPLDEDS